MNHLQCKAKTTKRAFEPQGDGYFIVRDNFLCEHGEIVGSKWIDSYLEGNILGAWKDEWGKH